MEEIVEEQKEELKVKKKFTILNFSPWRILAYFIIYSFLGYIFETIFGMMTKGVVESRQSFLYGPFCCIYGVGAVFMTFILQYFNKNQNTLFLAGLIAGSIVEYSVSFFSEKIFNVIWWDYSNMPLNINGRICALYSIFWGFLAIYLVGYANPTLDKFLNWINKRIPKKHAKVIIAIISILLFIDWIVSSFALNAFVVRKAYEYNLNTDEREKIVADYNRLYVDNPKLGEFINKHFSDYVVIRALPNLKTVDRDGNMIYYENYVGDIKTYYYKFNIQIKDSLQNVINLNKGEALEEN